MKIGYTMKPGQGDTDLFLSEVAKRLQGLGLCTCGVVQINTTCKDEGPCNMDVQVLPSGPSIRISQSLGKNARGCRLDPDALERAVGFVEVSLADGADVLIINKFGKHEASGRGFRTIIAEAVSQEIPIIVGLNELNKEAFEEFSAGCAELIPANLDAIAQWTLAKVNQIGVSARAKQADTDQHSTPC